jgi:hypothetical protein
VAAVTTQADLVSRVLALTQRIEAAARAADWDDAAALADQRAPLLMSIEPEQTPDALVSIRQIQHIDATVTALLQDAQAALSAEYSRSLRRAHAAATYQQAARF